MFDGARKDVCRYRNILGKTVPVLASETAVTERCNAGRFCVSSGTLCVPFDGTVAPKVYVLQRENTPPMTHGKIIAVLLPAPAAQLSLPVARFVAVPEDVMLFEPDIKALLGTREDWPQTRMYCLQEKSCGAVLYAKHGGKIYYLLIRNQSGHIGFPKGHMEYGENEMETIVREIREETGLAITPDISFREEYDYMLCGVIHKKAVYCIAEFNYYSEITLGPNEIFGKWLVPYEEARKKLLFANDRSVLQKAHRRILGIR